MLRRISLPIALVAAAALLTGTVNSAEKDNSPETRLREQLKNTLLQLRQAQGDRDAALAAKALLESEKKTLTDKADLLTKQSIADKDASDKKIASLSDKVSA